MNVSEQAQEEIVKLVSGSGRYTPKNIIQHLEEMGIDPPKMKHLYNFLQRCKNNKFGGSKITLGELVAWCEENSTVPSLELTDEPFVVDYDSFFPDSIDNDNENYEKGDSFRFFISTRGLL